MPILNYKVDGQLRNDPTQVFEFYGCLFHGCPDCYSATTELPKSRLVAAEALAKTRDRNIKLQEAGRLCFAFCSNITYLQVTEFVESGNAM